VGSHRSPRSRAPDLAAPPPRRTSSARRRSHYSFPRPGEAPLLVVNVVFLVLLSLSIPKFRLFIFYWKTQKTIVGHEIHIPVQYLLFDKVLRIILLKYPFPTADIHDGAKSYMHTVTGSQPRGSQPCLPHRLLLHPPRN
jgi:hypothetical protein